MRQLITLILILAISSCMPMSGGRSPLELPPSQKIVVKEEVDLFLSTTDPAVENAVLSRLKGSQVSNELVKSILQESAPKTVAQTGLQLDLEKSLNDKSYPYALYVPAAAKPGDSYPLMIVLHGMGGSGSNTIANWVERLAEDFIILCPSYPMGAWWAQPAEDLVLQLVQEVQTKYPVDPNRIFLSGLSNGAIGAYMIGMFYPDLFAGIIPIASGITPRYMHFLVNLKNTPIYIIQGVHDPVFPIQLTRRVHKILTDMKYPVVYREHEEKGSAHGGHFLPNTEVPPLVEWMKKQNRNPNPMVVRMTREANHLGRIHWVRLSKGLQMAALQLPGPEKELVNVQDGKIATLFATQKGNNEFDVMGKNLVEFELFFNTDMVDFDAPVRVFTQKLREEGGKIVTEQKQEGFNNKLVKDLEVLLRDFKQNRDPSMLFDAKITISLDKTFAQLTP
jgi:predicted esterase/predicted small lipoprotein YifL